MVTFTLYLTYFVADNWGYKAGVGVRALVSHQWGLGMNPGLSVVC